MWSNGRIFTVKTKVGYEYWCKHCDEPSQFGIDGGKLGKRGLGERGAGEIVDMGGEIAVATGCVDETRLFGAGGTMSNELHEGHPVKHAVSASIAGRPCRESANRPPAPLVAFATFVGLLGPLFSFTVLP